MIRIKPDGHRFLLMYENAVLGSYATRKAALRALCAR